MFRILANLLNRSSGSSAPEETTPAKPDKDGGDDDDGPSLGLALAGNPFAELLRRQMMGEDEPSILPEAAVARLKEVHGRIQADNPFKVGDLVHPRADAPVKGRNHPHLVVAVNEDVADDGYVGRQDGSWNFGTANDMRVLSIKHDKIVPHLVHSWMMEPWTQPQAGKGLAR